MAMLAVDLLLLAASATAAVRPECPPAAIAPELPVCLRTPAGIVMGRDRRGAERLAGYARSGERNFARFFGRPVAPYAVVASTRRGLTRALEARGFSFVLPWDPMVLLAVRMKAARAAAEQRAKSEALSGRQLEEIVAAEHRKLAGELRADREGPILVPHELGHSWFVQAFWPADRSAGHYGGPGPDWLDEIGAILMEPREGRKLFNSDFRSRVEKAGGPISFLRNYLNQVHPWRNALKPPESADGHRKSASLIDEKGNVIPIDFNVDWEATHDFYDMGSVFADFLIERSGNDRIFSHIATALAGGSTFEAWLRSHGAANRLGGSLPLLETAWSAWLERNYPSKAKGSAEF